jgi:hypothetical protein
MFGEDMYRVGRHPFGSPPPGPSPGFALFYDRVADGLRKHAAGLLPEEQLRAHIGHATYELAVGTINRAFQGHPSRWL